MPEPHRGLAALAAIVAVSLTTIATGAVAEDAAGGSEPDYTAPGLYLYFGGATGIDTGAADTLNALAGAGGLVEVDPAIGFNVRVGARSGRWLAGEVQLEYLPSFDFTVLGVQFARNRLMTLTGNAKLFLAGGGVQPYLLLGGGGTFAELSSPFVPVTASASGFAVRGGGGLQLAFGRHVALAIDASYVYPTGDTSDLDYVSIGWGLQYTF